MIITLLEIALIVIIVIKDIWLPTVLILVLAIFMTNWQKRPIEDLGLRPFKKPIKAVLLMIFLATVMQLTHFVVTMPLLGHLTNTTKSLVPVNNLHENLSGLFLMLGISWTMAAVGEEIVYRGYLLSRIKKVFEVRKHAVLIGIILTSMLFGWAHREQGIMGIIITAIDGGIYSIIKEKFKSIWPAVIVHGMSNTIGLVAVYFLGTINFLW